MKPASDPDAAPVTSILTWSEVSPDLNLKTLSTLPNSITVDAAIVETIGSQIYAALRLYPNTAPNNPYLQTPLPALSDETVAAAQSPAIPVLDNYSLWKAGQQLSSVIVMALPQSTLAPGKPRTFAANNPFSANVYIYGSTYCGLPGAEQVAAQVAPPLLKASLENGSRFLVQQFKLSTSQNTVLSTVLQTVEVPQVVGSVGGVAGATQPIFPAVRLVLNQRVNGQLVCGLTDGNDAWLQETF